MTITSFERESVLRARLGVFVIFAICGTAFASWASRIPDLKRQLDLSPGQLGGVLLAIALGSVIGLPLAGRLIERVGTARAVRLGAATFLTFIVVAAIGVDFVHNVWFVAVPLFLAGLGVGVWDVSMNHEGTMVEQGLDRAIMPWFHASFSGATVVAALLGSVLTAVGVPIWIHITALSVIQAVAAWWSTALFFPVEPTHPDDQPQRGRSAWLEPRILLVGVVVLAAAFTEGTANDWIAVALVEGHQLPSWVGVLGFATFLGAMTVGRIAGTYALDRFGRVPVLWGLFVMAILGSLLVVFGGPIGGFVGSTLWGLGASLGFPVGMSAAADDPARAAARLSVVSTIGYLAFLGGPPLLGFLGDHVGVLMSLLAVTALLVPALLAVPSVREPARN